MKYRAVGLAAALSCACGGSSPTAPEVSAPSAIVAPAAQGALTFGALTFRDGWTEQPIDAQAAPSAPRVGTVTSINAPGYLTRLANFDGHPFYLWPQSPEYVEALVYNQWMPGRRLSRWRKEAFTVGASAEILADIEARGLIENAVHEVASAVPVAVRFGGPADVTFEIVAENPWYADGRVGTAFIDFRGNEIAGARIIFRDIDSLIGKWGQGRWGHPPLHELGHVLGLGHAGDTNEIMGTPGGYASPARAFSERERIALRLMYRWRQPGNTFPDKAQLAGASSTTRHTVAIVD